MKRPQRLESAKSWLETYEGSKVVKAYRKIEMLGVPIDLD
jgi:hypothetical protein